MPLIARETDQVLSPTGGASTTIPPCLNELLVAIVGRSDNVFVEGIGVSRLNDAAEAHSFPLNDPPCSSEGHIPLCSQASDNVYVNQLPVARMGDFYTVDEEDHPVTVISQETVFANGE